MNECSSELYKLAQRLCIEIQSLPAGEQQTKVMAMADELMRDLKVASSGQTTSLIDDIRISRYGRPLVAALQTCLELEGCYEALQTRMFDLASLWGKYANDGSGRHPWASETLLRCSNDLKREIETPSK